MRLSKTVLVLSAVLLCTSFVLAGDNKEAKPPPVTPAALYGPNSLLRAQPAPPSTSATADVAQKGPRQGGDTCAGATVIPALPYTDTGTTSGYTNDYDEVCPYTASTAPDVAYSFTPGGDVSIDVTCCVDQTDYDTKVYIYQDSCPGTLIACNDDACTSPYYGSPYVSQLTNVFLSGGHTYYIIVDGYGTAAGTYTLDVAGFEPPPGECPEGSLFAQNRVLPDGSWTFATSDSGLGYIIYENISGVTGQICDVHWWGLDLYWAGGWSECVDNQPTFEIKFYFDTFGAPGEELCSYTVVPTYTPIELYAGAYMCNKYEVPLLNPCCVLAGGVGWISIQDVDPDCVFLWLNSFDGDNYALQGSTPLAYDLSLCLTGEYVPTYGACCDDDTGVCTDNVEAQDCPQPLRFAADTLCADLVPPCGEVVGACCYADQPCEILTSAACAASGGEWLGEGTTCDMCPCIVLCPEGGVPEQEPCGDDTNGGCNMTTPTFEAMTCGVPVCGTYWFDGSTRDTDWYQIDTDVSTIFTITFQGEGPSLFGKIGQVVDGLPGCANTTGSVDPYGLPGECEEMTVISECLPPGTYYFFAATQFTDTVNCPADYYLIVECEPCYIPTGACCLQDGTCIPDQAEEQCTGVGGQWQGDGTVCEPNPCEPYSCTPCFTNCGDGTGGTPDDWISNVTFVTINNETGPEGCPCSYGNYTGMSTTVSPGATYDLTVSVFSEGIWTQHVSAWFDWNQNLVYEESERYYLGSGVDPTLTAPIMVPAGALEGATTMRVIERWNAEPTDPCEDYSYGEAEDYTVIVGIAGACCFMDASCDVLPEEDCLAAGGEYQGDGTDCSGDGGGGGMLYEADPNLAIPDGSGEFVTDTITVPDSFTAYDVNVDVQITHTWLGDLIIEVEHNGTIVRLWDRQCGSNDNLDVIFDDQGDPVACASPTTGNAIPFQALAAFNGMEASGDWTIRVSDNAGADTGTLNHWSLHLTDQPAPGPGACCLCVDGESICVIAIEACCEFAGGTFLGPGTNCGGFEGYVAEMCDSDFFDISGTGTEISLPDDGGQVVPIGFTFNFYGDDHTEIGVASNGYLTFGTDLSDLSEDPIPNTMDPNDLIAMLWDDLDPGNAGSPATVHYQTIGDQFIVQFTDVPEYPNTGANTFQAVLFEGTNCIQLRYLAITTSDYVAGVENQDGTEGIDVTGMVAPGACIEICPTYSEPPCPPCIEYGYLDIKPGSCPNSFNPGSHGVLPVAYWDEIDVHMIDISTVRLSRADGVGGSVAPNEGPPGPHTVFADVMTPFYGEPCDCHELEGDGLEDLSMKFRTDDVVAALMLDGMPGGSLVPLKLTGNLMDGTPFEATDCVRLVPPIAGNPIGAVPVRSNAEGAWVNIVPWDMKADGGGFTNFRRLYGVGTLITLTTEPTYMGREFLGWKVDGVMVPTLGSGKLSIQVKVDALTTVEAVFSNPPEGTIAPANLGP